MALISYRSEEIQSGPPTTGSCVGFSALPRYAHRISAATEEHGAFQRPGVATGIVLPPRPVPVPRTHGRMEASSNCGRVGTPAGPACCPDASGEMAAALRSVLTDTRTVSAIATSTAAALNTL